MHQASYINELLEKYDCDDEVVYTSNVPVVANQVLSVIADGKDVDKQMYQQAVGSLLYAALLTRPDIAFAVSHVSRFAQSPKLCHWLAVKRIFRYLKKTRSLGLVYNSGVDWRPVAYSDSDFAMCPDTRRSMTGGVIMMCGACVMWLSKRQTLVSCSTCEAEYIAANSVATELRYVRNLLTTLRHTLDEPSTLFVDNTSAICSANNRSLVRGTKHIDLRHHCIRDLIEEKIVCLKYVESSQQCADIFTKALAKNTFERGVDMLRLI